MNVTISLRSASTIRNWIRDMMKVLHASASANEHDAFLELHGAVEDGEWEDKTRPYEEMEV